MALRRECFISIGRPTAYRQGRPGALDVRVRSPSIAAIAGAIPGVDA